MTFIPWTQIATDKAGLLDDIRLHQEEVRESNRTLSQKFEQVLSSPLLRPVRLKLASNSSTAESEDSEVIFTKVVKRKANSPPEGEGTRKGSTMEAKMDRILANMATSEALEKLDKKIEGRLRKVEENQVELRKNQRDMLGRINELEKERTRSITKAKKTEQRLKRLTEEGLSLIHI